MQKLKQPKALYFLFLTELWERFGFYMLQSLAVLYMSRHLGFSDQQTYALYAVFGTLVYLTPIAGGFFAERLLGYQRAVFLGSILLAGGYALAALSHGQGFFQGSLS